MRHADRATPRQDEDGRPGGGDHALLPRLLLQVLRRLLLHDLRPDLLGLLAQLFGPLALRLQVVGTPLEAHVEQQQTDQTQHEQRQAGDDETRAAAGVPRGADDAQPRRLGGASGARHRTQLTPLVTRHRAWRPRRPYRR